MSAIEKLLKSRVERSNLKAGTCYTKIQVVNGIQTAKCVGKFIRAYRMGSGDGMTCHWEFDLKGTVTCVDDEMWGSVSGKELAYFAPCNL
jgi:hypothetical protein